MKRIEQHRSHVFDRLQASTLEVLGRPEVIDALGDTVKAITEGAENAYCLNKIDGRLSFRYDFGVERIGFYPLLASDIRPPRYLAAEWFGVIHNPHDEPSDSKPRLNKMPFKHSGKHSSLRRPTTPIAYDSHATDLGISHTISQPMVVVPAEFAKKQPEYVAVTMAHYIDHALRLPIAIAEGLEPAYATPEQGATPAAKSDLKGSFETAVERPAHELSYNMAKALVADPMPDNYFSQIIGKEGAGAAALAVKEELERIRLSSETDLYHLMAVSLGAVSLSRAFGKPEAGSLPTVNEITAYRTAELIH